MIHNPADLRELEAAVADIIEDVAAVHADVIVLRAVVDALGILTETGGELTTDGTEQNIYVNDTPAGVFRPVCLKLDFTNQTVTETVIVNTYYRIKRAVDGGVLRLQDGVTFAGVQDPVLINIDLEPNRFGVCVTIEKTAGTNRAYDWEVFYESAV